MIICLFLIACAGQNQIPKSLSSSYDGIWEGYAQITEDRRWNEEGRYNIKFEIKNGIMSGFVVEDAKTNAATGDVVRSKFKGYVKSDNNLIINPVHIYLGYSGNFQPPSKLIFETNFMSPSRIEGTCYVVQIAQAPKYDWFVAKPATGKSDNTISNVEGN